MNQEFLYEMAAKMEPSEAMKLLMASENEEERRFYAFIVNLNLPKKQKEVIEKNLF